MAALSGAVGNAFTQLEGLGLTNGTEAIVSAGEEAIAASNHHEAEIKALEEELRKRSKNIAQHQGHLADLGSIFVYLILRLCIFQTQSNSYSHSLICKTI